MIDTLKGLDKALVLQMQRRSPLPFYGFAVVAVVVVFVALWMHVPLGSFVAIAVAVYVVRIRARMRATVCEHLFQEIRSYQISVLDMIESLSEEDSKQFTLDELNERAENACDARSISGLGEVLDELKALLQKARSVLLERDNLVRDQREEVVILQLALEGLKRRLGYEADGRTACVEQEVPCIPVRPHVYAKCSVAFLRGRYERIQGLRRELLAAGLRTLES